MPKGTPPETIGFIVGYVLAILSTVLRLGHRLHRRQQWWDDFWALVAVFFTIFNLIVYLVLNIPENVVGLYSPTASSFLLWVSFQFQPLIIWSSRLSIQVTVIRFLAPGRNRCISKWACYAMAAMWAACAITKVFYCGTPVPQIPNCIYKQWPSIVALVTDVVSTTWLIGWPIYILARMKMRKAVQRLVLACFAAGGLLGAIVIFHAANLITGATKTLNISGHLQIMLSVVFCNLLVLVTYMYRLLRGPNDGDESDSSTESSTSGDDEFSRSKREITDRPTMATERTGQVRHPTTTVNEYATQDSNGTSWTSSVGPLTTLNTSDFSADSRGGFNSSFGAESGSDGVATSRSEVTNPTSPLVSMVSTKPSDEEKSRG